MSNEPQRTEARPSNGLSQSPQVELRSSSPTANTSNLLNTEQTGSLKSPLVSSAVSPRSRAASVTSANRQSTPVKSSSPIPIDSIARSSDSIVSPKSGLAKSSGQLLVVTSSSPQEVSSPISTGHSRSSSIGNKASLVSSSPSKAGYGSDSGTVSSSAKNSPAPIPRFMEAVSVDSGSDTSKLKFTITSSVPVHSAIEKEFTAFLVTIVTPEGENKTILRRYRQFAALHASVAKAYPDVDLPHFPKKRMIGNMSQQVVEKRRRKLEAYLQFVGKLPNIDELLGFVTFLGSDLAQRGSHGAKKKGLTTSADKELEELYKETDKEKEQRVAAERRYNEVKYYVSRLDSCIYKLEAVELAFEKVYETTDFVIHSEYSKLVVILGKYLGSRPLSSDFVPRELSKDKEELIVNPKIRSIRQKIIPAISELVSKLRDIKEQMLDVTYPMDQVLQLTHIVEDVQDIFDDSNLVPKALGFRIEAGATQYEAMTERWPDYIESNIYWYKTHFFGTDHIIAYNGDRPEGAVTVALKPEKLEENWGEFRMFTCTRDGNDCITTKVHFSRLESEWRERFAEILTAADPRLRGIEWTTCSSLEGEKFIVDHEKMDMRITRKLKFGVLLCLKDQEKEEDMFDNYQTTPAFEHLLEGLGNKVELSGYTGFAGGLDTRGSNSTGTHSYVANWEGPGTSGNFQLMYHVSTMLPHGEQDQNLAKKRHIGNDIVAIVFQEDGSKPFAATTIKSNYIQITIVVRAINLGEGRWAWRVTVSSAQDVPEFGPPLPYPPIFTDREVLSKWLIHKMVNGELAAYRGKLFIQQFRSTWKTLTSDLVSKLPSKKRSKSSSKTPKKK